MKTELNVSEREFLNGKDDAAWLMITLLPPLSLSLFLRFLKPNKSQQRRLRQKQDFDSSLFWFLPTAQEEMTMTTRVLEQNFS